MYSEITTQDDISYFQTDIESIINLVKYLANEHLFIYLFIYYNLMAPIVIHTNKTNINRQYCSSWYPGGDVHPI